MPQKTKTEKKLPDYTEGMTGGTLKDLKLSKLALDYRDMEFRVSPRVKDLVEDIGKNGQQFPILVRPLEGGKYEVISGYRRVRAIQALGWDIVKAVVRDDLGDDDMAYKVSYLENDKRKSLTGVDKAHAISKLLNVGKTGKQIQEIFDISERQFQRYQKVATFPKVLKDALTDGAIQTTHGLVLMQAFEAHGEKVDLKKWLEWIAEAGEKNEVSVRQLKQALNKECGKVETVPRYFEKKGKGFRLYPMSFDPAKTNEATKELMREKLRKALEMLG